MKTNFLILLFIVVATISCEKRSVEMQNYGTTIEIKITTSSTVRVNDIFYSDYLLKIRNSELEINTDADLIVVTTPFLPHVFRPNSLFTDFPLKANS